MSETLYRIKPLEWKEDAPKQWRAWTPFGYIEVFGGKELWRWSDGESYACLGRYANFCDAKAQAEAWFHGKLSDALEEATR